MLIPNNSHPSLATIFAVIPNAHYLVEKLGVNDEELKQPLDVIATQKGFTENFLEALLVSYASGMQINQDALKALSAGELMKYLSLSHRYYLEKKLPEIEQHIEQVVNKHGACDPLATVLCALFEKYRQKLEAHIRYEEEVFFPYALRLINGEALPNDNRYNSTIFLSQHTSLEDDLQFLCSFLLNSAHKTQQLLPYNVFLSHITLLEADLHQHSCIEEQVLVPKIQELETLLNA